MHDRFEDTRVERSLSKKLERPRYEDQGAHWKVSERWIRPGNKQWKPRKRDDFNVA